MATCIISLTGLQGSGKTTVACCLSSLLEKQHVLFIDTSTTQNLTLMLTQQLASMTFDSLLPTLVTPVVSTHTNQAESIDWSFHELPVHANDTQDVIALGSANTLSLDDEALEKCCYGMSRLVRNYDLVVVDGNWPLLYLLFSKEPVHVVRILTPETLREWHSEQGTYPHETALDSDKGLIRQSILLNQASTPDDNWPDAMQTMAQTHAIQLLGRLPHYVDENTLSRAMPDRLKSCLLRLDTPFRFEY